MVLFGEAGKGRVQAGQVEGDHKRKKNIQRAGDNKSEVRFEEMGKCQVP